MTTITGLPTASGVDATQDWLAIDRTSLGVTQKINRDTYLGITSAPLGTSDAQSPTNKTFDNSNIFTIRDDRFTLQDNADTTKQAAFQLSGITTGTTRTYTLPNASVTLASLTGTETLTNKTITSPTISGGTISNTSVNVDSIAEFTAANGVTIDGMNIKDGKLNTNNAVVTANITDSAVTPNKLQTGAGTGWAWQVFTTTIAYAGGGSNGNATITGAYCQTGKTVDFWVRFVVGTTTSFAGTTSVSFTTPTTMSANFGTVTSANFMSGVALISGTYYPLGAIALTTTTIQVNPLVASGTYLTMGNFTGSTPGSWVTGSSWFLAGSYESV